LGTILKHIRLSRKQERTSNRLVKTVDSETSVLQYGKRSLTINQTSTIISAYAEKSAK
jgi:hypothetical protein